MLPPASCFPLGLLKTQMKPFLRPCQTSRRHVKGTRGGDETDPRVVVISLEGALTAYLVKLKAESSLAN